MNITRAYRAYQICDISDLDGIVNNLSSRTTVSLVKLYAYKYKKVLLLYKYIYIIK